MKHLALHRTFKGTLSSLKQMEHNQQPIFKYLEYITGKMLEGRGTFPYEDAEWWRQYKRHCSEFRTYLEFHAFNTAGKV